VLARGCAALPRYFALRGVFTVALGGTSGGLQFPALVCNASLLYSKRELCFSAQHTAPFSLVIMRVILLSRDYEGRVVHLCHFSIFRAFRDVEEVRVVKLVELLRAGHPVLFRWSG
jgi:hypothetical protein